MELSEADKIDTLIFSIERIGKLVLIKLEKGQSKKVEEYLIYLFDTFNKVLKQGKYIPKEEVSSFSNLSDIDLELLLSELKKPVMYKSVEASTEKLVIPKESSQKLIFPTTVIAEAFNNLFTELWIKLIEKKSYRFSLLISQKITDAINSLINYKASRNIIEGFLYNLYNLSSEGIKATDEDRRQYLTNVCFYWYFNIVFKQDFNLKYSDSFDDCLFRNIQLVIDKNDLVLFESFVEAIINGQYATDYFSFKYSYLLGSGIASISKDKLASLEVDRSKLVARVKSIYSQNDFDLWLADLVKFRSQFSSVSTNEELEIIDTIYIELEKYATKNYKYQKLKSVCLKLGAYCVFKDKFNLIKILFEFNQPPDTEASWSNKDVNPLTLKELSSTLSLVNTLDYQMAFKWSGHHGFKAYFLQYTILLFVNAIRLAKRNGKVIQNEINADSLLLDKTNSIKYDYQTLKTYIPSMRNKIEDGVLNELRTREEELQEVEDLIKLIEVFIEQTAENDMQKALINKAYVENFRNQVIDYFYQFSIIRNIYSYLKKYENKIDEGYNHEDIQFLGLNEITEKGLFIANKESPYYGFTDGYAERLAYYENNYLLLNLIEPRCTKKDASLKDFIEEMKKIEDEEDGIILSINKHLDIDLLENKEFFPSWKESKINDKLKRARYIGKLSNGIKIFQYYDQTDYKRIIYLKTKRAGNLIQLSPIKNDDLNGKKSLNDIFYFEIKAFNEDQELLNSYIANPPYWLAEHGDEKSQRAFLMKSVSIKIFERLMIEFEDTTSKIGTRYIINDSHK